MKTDKVIFKGTGFYHVFVGDRGYAAQPGEPLELPAWKCEEVVKSGLFKYAGKQKSKIKKSSIVNGMYKGKDIFIVGSGSSLKDFDFTLLDNEITIALNGTISFMPWATMLLFSEESFLRGSFNIDKYKGTVFSSNFTSYDEGFKFELSKTITEKFEDGLYSSQLSGALALNLALLMGAENIYLLGFDMDGKYFYKDMDDKKYIAAYKKKLKIFDAFSFYADKIINCSEESLLTQFNKVDILKIKNILELRDIC